MAYIEIDVDLSEFNDDEVIDELKYRIVQTHYPDEDIKELLETIKDNKRYSKLFEDIDSLPIKTLDDKLKLEHLLKIWNDYTADEIENLLPLKK